jgi:hypothetical protein
MLIVDLHWPVENDIRVNIIFVYTIYMHYIVQSISELTQIFITFITIHKNKLLTSMKKLSSTIRHLIKK